MVPALRFCTVTVLVGLFTAVEFNSLRFCQENIHLLSEKSQGTGHCTRIRQCNAKKYRNSKFLSRPFLCGYSPNLSFSVAPPIWQVRFFGGVSGWNRSAKNPGKFASESLRTAAFESVQGAWQAHQAQDHQSGEVPHFS